MVLVGTRRSGKSSTGNSMLRAPKFLAGLNGGRVTRDNQKEETTVNNKTLAIVDTPGFVNMQNDSHVKSIMKLIGKGAESVFPGPNVFLFVFSILGFSYADEMMINYFCKEQEEMIKYVIAVFTGRDILEKNEGCNFDTYKSQLSWDSKQFLNKLDDRVFAIDNNSKNDKEINDLINKIEEVSNRPSDCFYHCKKLK